MENLFKTYKQVDKIVNGFSLHISETSTCYVIIGDFRGNEQTLGEMNIPPNTNFKLVLDYDLSKAIFPITDERIPNIMQVLTGGNGATSWLCKILNKYNGTLEIRTGTQELTATVNFYLMIPKYL